MTNYGENRESPDAIKAEIERTRSQMSNKIDTLQERLHPDNLKHQAQEAVQSALQEGADTLKSYIQDHSSELRDSVVDSFKRNPIPTALVGLGLGWILLESFGSREKEYSYRREWVDASEEGRYARSQGYGGEPNRSYSAYANTAQPAYRNWARSSGEFSGEYAGSDEGTNGHSDTVGDKVQQLGSAVKEKASQAVEQIQDTAGQVASQVSDKTHDLSHQAREQAARLGDQTGRQVQQAGQQAYHVLEENPLAVGAAALALGAVIGLLLPATRHENQMVGDLRDQVIEKGKAVAENVAQRVQEVVEEVKPEVQQMASRVVQDLKPEVEQLGQKVADDLKQAGQQALNTASKSSETSASDDPLVREPATPTG